MALQLQSDTNEGLIMKLQMCGIIKNEKVADVMKQTDRMHYCPATNPYIDRPEPIGLSAKISAPDIHALALETLADLIKPDSMILDVGAGSGYLTTCFARLMEMKAQEENVQPTGRVIGVDVQKNLLRFAEDNIKRDDYGLIENERVILLEGDGKMGCDKYAPYDIIYVGAATFQTPNDLLLQLKPGGHMICPIEGYGGKQFLMHYYKELTGEVFNEVLSHVVFDPMIVTDQTQMVSVPGEDTQPSEKEKAINNNMKAMNGTEVKPRIDIDEDADKITTKDESINAKDEQNGEKMYLNAGLYDKSDDLSNASIVSLKSFKM